MRRSTALTFQMIKTSRIPAALKAGLAGLGAAGAFAGLGGLTMYGLTGGPARTEAIGNNEARQIFEDMIGESNRIAQRNNSIHSLTRDPDVRPLNGAGPMVVDTSDLFAAGPAMGREIMRRLSRTIPRTDYNPSATIRTELATEDFFNNPFGGYGSSPLSNFRSAVNGDMMESVAGPKETFRVFDFGAPDPTIRDYFTFSNLNNPRRDKDHIIESRRQFRIPGTGKV